MSAEAPGPRSGSKVRELARALGLFALLTVLLTWPMVTRLRLMDAGDSAFFAWVMSWELHALWTDIRELPHGNIFHPLRYTVGLDEPVFGTTLLILPLRLFTSDAVFLFNVARLLTFTFSAFTAYLLLREIGCPEGPSLIGGIAFGFSPIRTDQIAHLSTLGTQWLPLVLLFTHRFGRSGRLGDALLAGGSFVLVCLACGYHGIIGLAVLPAAALPLVWGRWRRLAPAALAVGATAVALLPLQALHDAALVPHQYGRGLAETVYYSASLETFFATNSWNRLYGVLTTPLRTASNELFTGLVRPGVILVAAVVLWRRRENPGRDTWVYVVMAAAAAVVALGPEIRLFGRTLAPGPFAWLRDTFPVFRMIRVTSRAGAFLDLATAALCALALARLALPRGRLLLVALAMVVESAAIPIPMPRWTRVIDTSRPPPSVYTWLAEQPGDFAIVELPMLDIRGILQKPAYHESIYLVYSTLHWKRLVNGFAGILPSHYAHLRTLSRAFPTEECLDAYAGVGVRYVVLHRGGYGPYKWDRIEKALPRFRHRLKAVVTFGGDTVYELLPATSPSEVPPV